MRPPPPTTPEDDALIASVRVEIAGWFARGHRDLPWRRTRDPYAIWVSEVMLQQTRVDTAIPYFERFMKTFPTVSALAEADQSQVLTLWSGLGYYRRARLLHQGARSLGTQPLPSTVALLEGVPGIGR